MSNKNHIGTGYTYNCSMGENLSNILSYEDNISKCISKFGKDHEKFGEEKCLYNLMKFMKEEMYKDENNDTDKGYNLAIKDLLREINNYMIINELKNYAGKEIFEYRNKDGNICDIFVDTVQKEDNLLTNHLEHVLLSIIIQI